MRSVNWYRSMVACALTVGVVSASFAQTADVRPSSSAQSTGTIQSDYQFFIGQRIWAATWEIPFVEAQLVLPNPVSPVPVLQQSSKKFVSSTTVMPITALGVRFKEWTLAASILPPTNFSTGGIAIGDTVRRDESDVSLSYAFAPNLSGSIAFRTGSIDKLGTANATGLTGFSASYKIDTLLLGISGNAAIRGPLAIYGNFAIGPVRQSVGVAGLPSVERNGIYQISEVGLAYRLTDEREILGFRNLSIQFGYRAQSVSINDLPFQTYSVGPTPTLLSTNNQSVPSATQGFVVGIVAAF